MDKGLTNNVFQEAKTPTSTTGRLIPLKTTLETRARDSWLSVYITSVPAKKASGALK